MQPSCLPSRDGKLLLKQATDLPQAAKKTAKVPSSERPNVQETQRLECRDAGIRFSENSSSESGKVCLPKDCPSPGMDWRLCAEAWDWPMEDNAMLQRRPPGWAAGVAPVARASEPLAWCVAPGSPLVAAAAGAPAPAGAPAAARSSRHDPDPTLRLPVTPCLPASLRSETRVERGRRRYESRRNAVISNNNMQAAKRRAHGKSRPDGLTLAVDR